MSEDEWEKREREAQRRARRGFVLDIVTIVLILAIVACLLFLALRR